MITDEQLTQLQAPEHIGDGVYVKYDGIHISISVNDHNNPPVVHLGYHEMDALAQFSARKRRELANIIKESSK